MPRNGFASRLLIKEVGAPNHEIRSPQRINSADDLRVCNQIVYQAAIEMSDEIGLSIPRTRCREYFRFDLRPQGLHFIRRTHRKGAGKSSSVEVINFFPRE